MPLAYWCVLIAALLPLLWTGLAKAGGARQAPAQFDNAAPREFLARLTGWPQRANWAQQNALEAFGPFAAGVIIARQLDAPGGWVDALAVVFVAARLAHGVLYIQDRASLRSLAWLAGFVVTVMLFVVAATG